MLGQLVLDTTALGPEREHITILRELQRSIRTDINRLSWVDIFLFVTTQRDGSTLRIYSWGICRGYNILAEVEASNELVVRARTPKY